MTGDYRAIEATRQTATWKAFSPRVVPCRLPCLRFSPNVHGRRRFRIVKEIWPISREAKSTSAKGVVKKMTMRSRGPALRLSFLPVAVLFCLGTASFAGVASIAFSSFDFPGSTNTQATAISPSGEIVGRYNTADRKQLGVLPAAGMTSAASKNDDAQRLSRAVPLRHQCHSGARNAAIERHQRSWNACPK